MCHYHFKAAKTADSKGGTGMHWLAEAQKSKRSKIKEHLNKLKQQRMDGRRRRKTRRRNKERQKQKKDVRKKRQKKMRNEKKKEEQKDRPTETKWCREGEESTRLGCCAKLHLTLRCSLSSDSSSGSARLYLTLQYSPLLLYEHHCVCPCVCTRAVSSQAGIVSGSFLGISEPTCSCVPTHTCEHECVCG